MQSVLCIRVPCMFNCLCAGQEFLCLYFISCAMCAGGGVVSYDVRVRVRAAVGLVLHIRVWLHLVLCV